LELKNAIYLGTLAITAVPRLQQKSRWEIISVAAVLNAFDLIQQWYKR